MKFGYVRISTEEQNTARQYEALEKEGVERIFEDKMSGSIDNRPELDKLLGFVRSGDIIYVLDIDRIGRNMAYIINLFDSLSKRDVKIKVINQPMLDTTSDMSPILISLFAWMAEYERKQTLRRQAEGIAIAKAAGKYKGRKPIDLGDDFDCLYGAYLLGEITVAEMARQLKTNRQKIYREIKARLEKHSKT